MAEPLLTAHRITKSFGAIKATDALSLEVHTGEIHAVIGPNGAGKTTAIGQLSGELKSDAGRIYFSGREITRLSVHKRAHLGLARSYQITSIFMNFTAEDNVAMAIQAHDGHSFKFWKPARLDPKLREPARKTLQEIGLSHRAHKMASNLSHGEQRQLELAMALATHPSLLLLDEPMAGMGPASTNRMVDLLQNLKGKTTILMVEHDMRAVFALADRITVLVYGRAIVTGTPEQIRSDPTVQLAYLGKEG
ncbi:MAG: ABC transporter ATP-binding protein [Desulfobacterales bacterium]|nr:MAG: ABC transporter ATP-binding protein [Desulfobacterales bacterium]